MAQMYLSRQPFLRHWTPYGGGRNNKHRAVLHAIFIAFGEWDDFLLV